MQELRSEAECFPEEWRKVAEALTGMQRAGAAQTEWPSETINTEHPRRTCRTRNFLKVSSFVVGSGEQLLLVQFSNLRLVKHFKF
jgi:hypothetical protein